MPSPEADLEAAGAPPPRTLASDAAGPETNGGGEFVRGTVSGSGSVVVEAGGICPLGANTDDFEGSFSIISM